eukprot:tig00000057_g44.t1
MLVPPPFQVEHTGGIISKEVYSEQKMLRILSDVVKSAPSLLLFVQSVNVLDIWHRPAANKPPLLLARATRSGDVDAVRLPAERLPGATVDLSGTIVISVEVFADGQRLLGIKAGTTQSTWRVRSRLDMAGHHRFFERMKVEQAQRVNTGTVRQPKYTPWAGVAACVSQAAGNERVEGELYSFLPTGVKTGLPVHINGVFTLTSSRHGLVSGEDFAHTVEGRWNKFVLEDIIGPLYAEVLEDCAGALSPADLYASLWPPREADVDALWHPLADRCLSEAVRRRRVVLASDGAMHSASELAFATGPQCNELTLASLHAWAPFNSPMSSTTTGAALALPPSVPAVIRALAAKQSGVLVGTVPASVASSLATCSAGSDVRFITVEVVRRALQQAPAPLLSAAADVREVLLHCLEPPGSPVPTGKDLDGILALPTCDGAISRLRIGNASGGARAPAPLFISHVHHRQLLPGLERRFLDVDPSTPLGMRLAEVARGLQAVQINVAVLSVEALCDAFGSGGLLPNEDVIDKKQLLPPLSAAWMQAVWEYSRECNSTLLLERWPLLPVLGDSLVRLPALPASAVFAGSGRLPTDVCASLQRVGVLCVDDGPAGIASFAALTNFVHPGAWQGVIMIRALQGVAVRSGTSIVQLAARAPDADVVAFRDFVAASAGRHLSEDDQQLLRPLPLFESLEFGTRIAPGDQGVAIAPDAQGFPIKLGADRLFKRSSRDVVYLLEALGVQSLTFCDYVQRNVVGDVLGQLTAVQDAVMLAVLDQLPSLSQMERGRVISSVRTLSFVACGHEGGRRAAPAELVDPRDSDACKLLPEGGPFPFGVYAKEERLAVLREMGLRSHLSSDEVVSIARSVAESGRSSVGRASLLLKYIHMHKHSLGFSDELRNELASISWLPFLARPASFPRELPWHGAGDSGSDGARLAAPKDAFPRSCEKLVSATRPLVDAGLNIVAGPIAELFGWTVRVDVDALAAEINALRQAVSSQPAECELSSEAVTALEEKTREIYGCLARMDGPELEKLAKGWLEGEQPWYWTGVSFLPSSRLQTVSTKEQEQDAMASFSVPPVLHCVPLHESIRLKALFTALKVQEFEKYSREAVVEALREKQASTGERPLSEAELRGVCAALHFVCKCKPEDNADLADLRLPAGNGVLRPASELLEADMDWRQLTIELEKVVHRKQVLIYFIFRARSFLPVPGETGLPVHVNAAFELASNRRDLQTGQNAATQAAELSPLNALYVNVVLPQAYARFVEEVVALKDVHAVLQSWPGYHFSTRERYMPLQRKTLQLLFDRPVLPRYAAGGGSTRGESRDREFIKASESLFWKPAAEPAPAPPASSSPYGSGSALASSASSWASDRDARARVLDAVRPVMDCLTAVGVLLVEDLQHAGRPYSIASLFEDAKCAVRWLAAEGVRARLREEPMSTAAQQYLQRVDFRERLAVLAFCLSDLRGEVAPAQREQLVGCPLVFLEGGRVEKLQAQALGSTGHLVVPAKQLPLFSAQQRANFVSDALRTLHTRELDLLVACNLNVRCLTFAALVDLLKQPGTPFAGHRGRDVPMSASTDVWPGALWDFVFPEASNSRRTGAALTARSLLDSLKDWPVIPTDDKHLFRPSSPSVVLRSCDPRVKGALLKLGVRTAEPTWLARYDAVGAAWQQMQDPEGQTFLPSPAAINVLHAIGESSRRQGMAAARLCGSAGLDARERQNLLSVLSTSIASASEENGRLDACRLLGALPLFELAFQHGIFVALHHSQLPDSDVVALVQSVGTEALHTPSQRFVSLPRHLADMKCHEEMQSRNYRAPTIADVLGISRVELAPFVVQHLLPKFSHWNSALRETVMLALLDVIRGGVAAVAKPITQQLKSQSCVRTSGGRWVAPSEALIPHVVLFSRVYEGQDIFPAPRFLEQERWLALAELGVAHSERAPASLLRCAREVARQWSALGAVEGEAANRVAARAKLVLEALSAALITAGPALAHRGEGPASLEFLNEFGSIAFVRPVLHADLASSMGRRVADAAPPIRSAVPLSACTLLHVMHEARPSGL